MHTSQDFLDLFGALKAAVERSLSAGDPLGHLRGDAKAALLAEFKRRLLAESVPNLLDELMGQRTLAASRGDDAAKLLENFPSLRRRRLS